MAVKIARVESRVPVPRVAVVIPCFKVRERVGDLLSRIGPEADLIICVDDCCPEGSGRMAERTLGSDPRLRVVYRQENGGVGAATVEGYREALAGGAGIIVKMDGDGQMDPRFLSDLIEPIMTGEADYVKCNRFFSLETVQRMPWTRVVGNAVLSFFSKLSTGYWDLFDPTNGFTAIEASVAAAIPLEKISRGYFFESDMLLRLGILRARVVELPAVAIYDGTPSHLRIWRVLLTFPFLHLRNLLKRVGYNYFLRNFSVASVNLVLGIGFLLFGGIYGLYHWRETFSSGVPATAGTVMLSALPVILGLQLVLGFLAYDMSSVPREVIHGRLSRFRVLGASDRSR